MKRVILGCLLFVGCVSTPAPTPPKTYAVSYPDGSDDAKAWACYRDPPGTDSFACLDLRGVVGAIIKQMDQGQIDAIRGTEKPTGKQGKKK